jgi:hypothetical protein
LIATLLVIVLVITIIGQYNKADVIISPVIGVLVGALYSYSDYEEGREHTLQCSIFFICITVIWMKPLD